MVSNTLYRATGPGYDGKYIHLAVLVLTTISERVHFRRVTNQCNTWHLTKAAQDLSLLSPDWERFVASKLVGFLHLWQYCEGRAVGLWQT